MQPFIWLLVSAAAGVGIVAVVGVVKTAHQRLRERKMWQATLRALAGS